MNLPNYDAWLERPYQDMQEESDRYIAWCEENGLDPDLDTSQDAYAEACEEDYEPIDDYEPDDDIRNDYL